MTTVAHQDVFRERTKIEEILHKGDEWFRTMFERHHAVLLLIDPASGAIVDVNSAAVAFYGFSRDQMRRMNIADINQLPPAEIALILDNIKTQALQYATFPHRLRNGEVRTVEVHSAPVEIDGQVLLFSIVHDITERKRTEQALRKSEQQFRALVENAPDAILIQTKGRVAYANHAAVQLYGARSAQDLLHQDLMARFHPDDHPLIRERSRLLHKEKQPVPIVEERHLRFDGTVIDVEVSAVPFDYEGGSGALMFARDIRWRKLAEAQAKRNEARLESLVDLLQYSTDSVPEFLDHALREAITLTESKFGTICHYDEDRREFVPACRSREATRECTHDEASTLRRFDGTGVWEETVRRRKPVLVNDLAAPNTFVKEYPQGHVQIHRYLSLPVFNGGRLVAVVAVANKETDYDQTDVLQLTLLMDSVWNAIDRKEAEARIEHLNRVLRAIRKVNQLIVRERDPQKLIKETCELLVETRGYRTAVIFLNNEQGKPVTFAEARVDGSFPPLAENLREGFLPPCSGALPGGEQPRMIEAPTDTCSGCPLAPTRSPIETMCTWLCHNDKTYGFLSVSAAQGAGRDEEELSLFEEMAGDVAFALHNIELMREASRAEQQRCSTEAQLRQAQKMEALGTLAGGIAHDFNNILGIISGYAELASWEAGKGSHVHSQIQEVLQAARRASDLVKQILAFSRQSKQQKKPLQIGVIVKEGLKMLRASLPSSIEIKPAITARSTIIADPTQIHQILMNLCTNAAHAMRDDGGLLAISLTDVYLDTGMIEPVSDLQPGCYVQLKVTDTGQGIAPDIKDRIFDPFFTTKDPGVGTGLGLAVVHGLVKSHGGEIRVDSSPGQGTSFRILFPAYESQAESQDEEGPPLPRGSERLLLVDDEPALAMAAKQMLERLGYRVDYRTSSIEALELFRHHLPDKPFDLLITDMTMPHMTGLELAGQVRRRQPNLAIILCTGFSEKVSAEQAKSVGIEGFLMKPLVLPQFATMVREVLDQRRQ